MEYAQKLIFVYNAKTGIRNAIIDGAHKIFSPETYACNLCKITFGAFTEEKEWKNFRMESELNMEFLYKDELGKKYASFIKDDVAFPLIFKEENGQLEQLVNAEELNQVKEVDELIKLVKDRS